VPLFLQKLLKRKRPGPSGSALSRGAGIATDPEPPDADAAPSSAGSTNLFDSVCAEAASCAGSAEFERAILLYDQAIALAPTRAEPYYRRANALRSLGRLDTALASYTQAIERRPDYAHAYCNRGVVQHALGLKDEALGSYERAVSLDGTDTMAHYNRAILLQEESRWQEALDSYGHAIAIDSQFSDARYNRSVLQLLLGDYESGWRGYEWRWVNAERLGIGRARTFAEPRWHGEEPIDGKRLLVYAEAGLGDTLQFCRYVTLCAQRGAKVILEAPASLCGLLENLDGVAALVGEGGTLPPFDYHCPLLSLPLAFRTTLETVPAPSSYLRSNPSRVLQWRTRLGPRRRPRVGLAWSGNPRNPMNSRRSVRLEDWLPSLPADFEYFRLQTQVTEADLAALDSDRRVVSFDNSLLDFENTAALCQWMDVIVTVDTSLAHLAGALGRKTWVLLPKMPDFRWLLDRDDSPWYPTVKLYRQTTAGDWSGVFARIAADLRELPEEASDHELDVGRPEGES
jgi:tetratricopeptide (TPR) repeat protein